MAGPASRGRCAARTSSSPPRSARCRPGAALLLATGIKPALIHLTPWYAGPRAAEITAALHAAQEQIREEATRSGATAATQIPGFRTAPIRGRETSRPARLSRSPR